jgi:hypothetical protein
MGGILDNFFSHSIILFVHHPFPSGLWLLRSNIHFIWAFWLNSNVWFTISTQEKRQRQGEELLCTTSSTDKRQDSIRKNMDTKVKMAENGSRILLWNINPNYNVIHKHYKIGSKSRFNFKSQHMQRRNKNPNYTSCITGSCKNIKDYKIYCNSEIYYSSLLLYHGSEAAFKNHSLSDSWALESIRWRARLLLNLKTIKINIDHSRNSLKFLNSKLTALYNSLAMLLMLTVK